MEFKEGDQIIWDSGFGYDYGYIVDSKEKDICNLGQCLKVHFTSGISTKKSHYFPKQEIKLRTIETEKEVKLKYK